MRVAFFYRDTINKVHTKIILKKIISKHMLKGIKGRVTRLKSRLTGFNSRYHKPVVDIWIRCMHKIKSYLRLKKQNNLAQIRTFSFHISLIITLNIFLTFKPWNIKKRLS